MRPKLFVDDVKVVSAGAVESERVCVSEASCAVVIKVRKLQLSFDAFLEGSDGEPFAVFTAKYRAGFQGFHECLEGVAEAYRSVWKGEVFLVYVHVCSVEVRAFVYAEAGVQDKLCQEVIPLPHIPLLARVFKNLYLAWAGKISAFAENVFTDNNV